MPAVRARFNKHAGVLPGLITLRSSCRARRQRTTCGCHRRQSRSRTCWTARPAASTCPASSPASWSRKCQPSPSRKRSGNERCQTPSQVRAHTYVTPSACVMRVCFLMSECRAMQNSTPRIMHSSKQPGNASWARRSLQCCHTCQKLATVFADVTALFFDEERNEIYTGNVHGHVHLWSN